MDSIERLIEGLRMWEENMKTVEKYHKLNGTKIYYTTDNVIYLLEKIIKRLENAN